MADLASMKDELAKLRDIRSRGVASYQINNRSMTYRSDRELAAAIADLEARIASVEGSAIRKIRVRSTRGLT